MQTGCASVGKIGTVRKSCVSATCGAMLSLGPRQERPNWPWRSQSATPSFVTSSSTPPRSAYQEPELLNVWISTLARSSSWPTTYADWPKTTSGCCSLEPWRSAAESSCLAQLPSTHSANSRVPPSTSARRSSASSATSHATMRSPERESSVFCHAARAERNPNHRVGCTSRYVLLCFHVGCHASRRRSSNQRLPPLRLPQHALVHSARSIGRRRDPPVRPLQSRNNDPGGRRTHRPRMAQPAGWPRRVNTPGQRPPYGT